MTSPRTLGSSDIQVPTVGVGCNAFGSRIDLEQTKAVVDAAIEHGVTFFDTADTYGKGSSEELLGRALGDRRDQVVIATKFGMDMEGVNGDDGGRRGTAAYVRTAVEASLRRLGTDHIDLYQLHTPDPSTPIEETLGALTELVVEGKVRAIGSSNLQAWQVVDADWRSRTGGHAAFVTAQNEYSLYNRLAEVELVPACLELGIGILPYFPLAYGLLTGKYRRGEAAPAGTRLSVQQARLAGADWDRIEALQAFADERGASLLDVAMGGLAAQPAVASVIAGVTRPEQVEANVAAAAWTPSADDLAALAAIGAPTQSYTTFAPR
ncbi:aldo/keto reductase [Aeromicrobium fastidiosum]|uniref:Aldo/keto reductase n=1 Tax=Aeromicrobium fastidiosum TaxID=52699 RepID=A0A641AL44_9ACTN|nr:aldo/keto reductase [Aeromicrobium fastidiosum]KAA1376093.1 aldo/keto reductase [Aeromicrobium fastidiosum]MBP2392030.1 aryl-alcohol dehydrogenase-like predicted oxidoreductase [Aeromicrobium fastidiosum]